MSGPAFTCRRCGFECHNAKHADEHDHCNPGLGFGHHNVAVYGAGECIPNPFASGHRPATGPNSAAGRAAIAGVGDAIARGFARVHGVDESARRPMTDAEVADLQRFADRVVRDRVERHPHRHGSECDVCRVLVAVATHNPWTDRGLPGQLPRLVCQWCGATSESVAIPRDDEHKPLCAWTVSRGLCAVYRL